MQYYSYRIQERQNESHHLLAASRLFPEYVCLAYATIDDQRLDYHRDNQSNLRAELYNKYVDAASENVDPESIGRKIICPSSLTGSVRDRIRKYCKSWWES